MVESEMELDGEYGTLEQQEHESESMKHGKRCGGSIDSAVETAKSWRRKAQAIKAKKSNCLQERDWLPDWFQPTENDMICGRGRAVSFHAGNRKFKKIVSERLKEYSQCRNSRHKKARLVASVINQIRSSCTNGIGGFVKLCPIEGRWYEVGDTWARERTSQAFRDVLDDLYKSSVQAKKLKREGLLKDAKEAHAWRLREKLVCAEHPAEPQPLTVATKMNASDSTNISAAKSPDKCSSMREAEDEQSSSLTPEVPRRARTPEQPAASILSASVGHSVESSNMSVPLVILRNSPQAFERLDVTTDKPNDWQSRSRALSQESPTCISTSYSLTDEDHHDGTGIIQQAGAPEVALSVIKSTNKELQQRGQFVRTSKTQVVLPDQARPPSAHAGLLAHQFIGQPGTTHVATRNHFMVSRPQEPISCGGQLREETKQSEHDIGILTTECCGSAAAASTSPTADLPASSSIQNYTAAPESAFSSFHQEKPVHASPRLALVLAASARAANFNSDPERNFSTFVSRSCDMRTQIRGEAKRSRHSHTSSLTTSDGSNETADKDLFERLSAAVFGQEKGNADVSTPGAFEERLKSFLSGTALEPMPID